MSATRSALFVAIGSMCLAVVVVCATRQVKLVWATVVSIAAVVATTIAFAWSGVERPPEWADTIVDRTMETDITGESRFDEASEAVDAMASHELVFGAGFGRQFEVYYGSVGRPVYIFALHIGILTPYLKGGLVGMGGILLPLAWFASIGLKLKALRDCVGWAASALVWYGMSSLSGGWYLTHLLLFGLCLGQVAQAYRIARSANSIGLNA
jgi:hypothetical protein